MTNKDDEREALRAMEPDPDMQPEPVTYDCDCCQYTFKDWFQSGLKQYDLKNSFEPPGENMRDLCPLCACTMTSTSMQYNKEDARVLQTICYVGNAILEKLSNMSCDRRERGDESPSSEGNKSNPDSVKKL